MGHEKPWVSPASWFSELNVWLGAHGGDYVCEVLSQAGEAEEQEGSVGPV